jgi:putative DNA methylase
MSYPIKSPRKLIEVALPLDAINTACAKEKSIRHGHPSTLHLWWARRPLAAARAVIFAQLVNDPGFQQGGGFRYGRNKKDAAIERARLFKIIEDLVLWENTSNEAVLESARAEIRRSWREVCELNKDHPQARELFNAEKLPAHHDPFAGGGAIPLEAQRLGLETFASDLNPVAVLINKAMIEVPPKFAGRPATNPGESTGGSLTTREWRGAQGLAEDVRYYGRWIRDEAEKRVGHLYPKVHVTAALVKERPDLAHLLGKTLTVIAWLWARTVKSPNPAFSEVDVPLTATFMLSTKIGKECYVDPVIKGNSYRFVVKVGKPDSVSTKNGTKLARANFVCLMSGTPIAGSYVKAEAMAGRMGTRMMAIVAESDRGRVYLPPTDEMEAIAREAKPGWKPDVEFLQQALGFRVGNYGMSRWSDLFTDRQLVVLTTFSDLVRLAWEEVRKSATSISSTEDNRGLADGGTGATAYADGVALYLTFAISKALTRNCTQTVWYRERDSTMAGFSSQTIPMTWDFAEVNPLLEATGSIAATASWVAEVLDGALATGGPPSHAYQLDAASESSGFARIISTDPPYYDNIGYADLSDFFYVWLRRSLKPMFPALFATLAVPKAEELVATPYRHGGKEKAEAFFLKGMTQAMHQLARETHPAFPVTIYYAFKQAENRDNEGTASTGWETFLDAVIRAGLSIGGTWPVRTEQPHGLRVIDANSLASSIVLVCRKRSAEALTISRREFLRELNSVLPEALDEMTKGAGGDHSPVAPVDLSQAIIGPGMAVFSKYEAVLEADGAPMSVRTALQLINRFLAEDDFDSDTQFCLRWFEQNGWKPGKFGDADTLARAKGTSVDGVKVAGVIESGGGAVRLLKWSEYPTEWDPITDTRNPVWETLHHLIRALKQDGETGAGTLLAGVKGQGEAARQLAYRLYTLCERQGWAEDARAYNELITSWSGIEAAAGTMSSEPAQTKLFE